jgi:hypothetical protein
MMRKAIVLILALALPAAVFVFLKQFGRNRFELPVYHSETLPSLPAGCSFGYTLPYQIPDSIASGTPLPSVFLIDFTGTAEARAQKVQIDRLTKAQEGANLRLAHWRADLGAFVCVFLVPDGMNAVLIDSERRIRGYYNSLSREDMDRLDLELRILTEAAGG